MDKLKFSDVLFISMDEDNPVKGFYCGDESIDKFFNEESVNSSRQMLSKTYYVMSKDLSKVLGAFAVSNSCLNMDYVKNSRRKKAETLIPHEKSRRDYPAILIAQLGSIERGNGVGTLMLDFVKMLFSGTNNKSGCRFVVVDSKLESVDFYIKNGFEFLYGTKDNDNDEKIALEMRNRGELKYRLMYYDLMKIRQVQKSSK